MKKEFTIENLQADGACESGMKYVTPLIKAGQDVAIALRNHPDWLRWALRRGYDCQSAWVDNVFTWDEDFKIRATAGDWGTATAGDEGTATAGDWGTAMAGAEGTATAGDEGTATAGDWGTAVAGKRGTAKAGERGTATAGNRGILQIKYRDGERWWFKTGYIGEYGLLPNTPYKLDENNNFIAASK